VLASVLGTIARVAARVSDEAVAQRLEERQALLKGEERLCLYQLLEEALISEKQLAGVAGLN
jgi:hypothetical protein